MKSWKLRLGLAVMLLLALLQLLPVPLPIARVEPSQTIYSTMSVPPDVGAIFQRSCQDCHSTLTVWPWYSHVAPVSWLLIHDVNGGRRELNLSEWGGYIPRRKDRKLKEICEQVSRGEMPMWYYLIAHSQARLSDQDKKVMCDWADAARKDLVRSLPDATGQNSKPSESPARQP
jgi:hypothetical protein